MALHIRLPEAARVLDLGDEFSNSESFSCLFGPALHTHIPASRHAVKLRGHAVHSSRPYHRPRACQTLNKIQRPQKQRQHKTASARHSCQWREQMGLLRTLKQKLNMCRVTCRVTQASLPWFEGIHKKNRCILYLASTLSSALEHDCMHSYP
jgi:hypothetical protein